MKLALSRNISDIDKYCAEKLGIPTRELVARSGAAVADAVISMTPPGGKVVFFCGKGNNGADGYSAAIRLIKDYKVVVFDVFGVGQTGEVGKYFLDKYLELGGDLRRYEFGKELLDEMHTAAAVVDAVFGTGFKGELPESVRALSVEIGKLVGAVKIAVDVPIGVNADDGSVDICTSSMSATVELSFVKPGILSYPARSYVGRIIYNDLGLPMDKILDNFKFAYSYVDEELACEMLPVREENSSKGTFGKALIVTGSEKYKGAAMLSLEGALRGGAGYVTYAGAAGLCDMLCAKFPEAIYKPIDESDDDEYIREITELSKRADATLVGSGSDSTERLCRLVCTLLDSEGGVLVLDADAINALSLHHEEGLFRIRNSKRKIILTPHPLEFSRLSLTDVASVQLNRISSAVKFAAENKCTLILKGAGTISTDGSAVYINSSGSSALAKAGSGDVLAGFVTSFAALGIDPLSSGALAAYLHGSGADGALDVLSSYGVTPSDLPRMIANQIAILEKKRKLCK